MSNSMTVTEAFCAYFQPPEEGDLRCREAASDHIDEVVAELQDMSKHARIEHTSEFLLWVIEELTGATDLVDAIVDEACNHAEL